MINFQELCQLLQNPKPNARVMSIHILRMVDEVQALDAIKASLANEKNVKVAHEFQQVADYLFELQQNGYNTIASICQQFNVYSDVLLRADMDRFEIVCRMVQQMQEKPKEGTIHNRRLFMALNLVSRILGDIRNVNAQELRQKLRKRIPPTTPTHADISRWTNALRSDNPLDRDLALHQLLIANNSVGLQYMAHTYMYDDDQKIRDTAKRLGRKLYWNRIYYEMEQDGTLDAIAKEFAISLRLMDDDRPKEVSQTDIASMLLNAENERKKRGWKS